MSYNHMEKWSTMGTDVHFMFTNLNLFTWADNWQELKFKNESLRKTIHTLKINLANKEKDKETGKDDECEEIEANSDKEINWSEDTIEESEAVVEVSENLNKWKTCDFIGKTEAGLKIHVTAKLRRK